MPKFAREVPPFHRSVPGYRFRRDSAQVNAHYWIGLVAESAVRFHIKKHPADADPMTALNLPSKFERRLGHDLSALKLQVDVHARWKNLSVLLLLTSALERYVADVAVTAINSDPTLEFGFPKKVDGLLLQKYDLAVPQPDLQALVKGTWPSRMKAMRTLFGDVTGLEQETLNVLERLRKTRNLVAHDFGFDRVNGNKISQEAMILIEGRGKKPVEHVRVSDRMITKYLDHAQKFVDAVDDFLLKNFIGAYEPAVIYLQWRENPEAFERSMGVSLTGSKKSHEIRFQNVLGAIFDNPFGKVYCRGLETYVNKL